MQPPEKSLADKLKALGVKVGAKDLPAHKASHVSVETVISGEYRNTPAGEVFVAESLYSPEDFHGRFPVRAASSLSGIGDWVEIPKLDDLHPESFAFLDTETSSLVGGTGTFVFMIGVGRFDGDQFRLAQFFMRDPSEEQALLHALADFLAPCSVLVTYNGKSFDAPMLRTRYRMHNLPIPFEEYGHIDLLHLARRLWRDRLSSRRLGNIEKEVLGVQRTEDEVPGYEVPYIYMDYVRTGDAAPLKGVFYHNHIDILSLVTLQFHAAALLTDPLQATVEHGLDLVSLARHFEDLKAWDIAARLYERSLEQEIPQDDFWTALKRLSILEKRRGDLESAVRLWERAAGEGHIYAHEELAKYYEHHAKDPDLALLWTERALKLAQAAILPAYVREYWQVSLLHRLERLKGKSEKLSSMD